MEPKNPISMGKLVKEKSTRIGTIIITAICVIILFAMVLLSVEGYKSTFLTEEAPTDGQIVTLKEVMIAYAPETKTIIFLDRKNGQVKFSLEDSLSLAVFALKSSEMANEYSSAMVGKK